MLIAFTLLLNILNNPCLRCTWFGFSLRFCSEICSGSLLHATFVLYWGREGLLPTPQLLVSDGRLWCSSLRLHAVTVGTSTRSQICQNAPKQRTTDPTYSPYPHGRILVLVGPRSVQIQCRESPELSVFSNDSLPASIKELKWVSSQNCARVWTEKALCLFC